MYRINPSKGFTLIELLVVISIIAVLAGLLIPAVNLVRESANGIRCMSSQRQVALAIFGYANDQDGELPALYLTDTPIATFWSHLILQDYLEAGKSNSVHTNFARTPMQGCPAWMRATRQVPFQERAGAYGMNSNPMSDNGVINPIHSDLKVGGPHARRISLRQITKASSRLLIADAINADDTPTHRLNPVTGTVTEASNAALGQNFETKLRSWHVTGRLIAVTMFDGHSEKRSMTAAAAAMTNP